MRKPIDEHDPLTDRDVLLELAREAIRQGRSTSFVLDLLASAHTESPSAPLAAPGVMPTVQGSEKKKPIAGAIVEGKKLCPHCHKTKTIAEFGTRKHRGVEKVQPWCRQCRSSTNYHNAPRVYKVDPDRASSRRED